MSQAQAEQIEFIRLPEVKRITSLGHTKIYELIKSGEFPDRIPLGANSVAWARHEVQAWARARLESARGQGQEG